MIKDEQYLNIEPTNPPPNYPAKKHSSHSFSHRPSIAQIVAYLIIIAEFTIYFTCIQHLYENWVLFGLYISTAILMLVAAIVSSCSNPTDPIVYRYKWSKLSKKVQFSLDFNQSFFCEHCDSFCSIKSKHCRVCNRCVDKFDHHCIWINNCIGNNNYKVFFILIISTFAHMLIFLISAGIMSSKASTEGGVGSRIGWLVPVWVMMVVLGILSFLLLQLIGLHCYLQYRGITTYEFLQERKKVEENEKKELLRVEMQRKLSIQQEQERSKRQQEEEQEEERSRRKMLESEQSNANVRITDEAGFAHMNESRNGNKKGTLVMDEEITETMSIKKRRVRTIGGNKVKNERMEEEYDDGQDEEGMPGFMKNNRSFRLIFGSEKVQAPKRSSKLINKRY